MERKRWKKGKARAKKKKEQFDKRKAKVKAKRERKKGLLKSGGGDSGVVEMTKGGRRARH